MTPLKDTKAEEYAQHIQQLVNQLKKTSKKAKAENEAYLVPPEIAIEKYGGRVGETFYLFPNDAPSQDIIDAYERVKPYYGTGEDAVSFEDHLSHRQMTVMFVDGDLVIRKDRDIYGDRLTESNLIEGIKETKARNQIDLANAKIFIYPYKSMDFYISDSIEPAYSLDSYKNPDNWLVFPFTDNFDYSEIRRKCREFVKNRPLEDDSPITVTINIDDRKAKESKPVIAVPDKPNNKGCMVFIGLILIPSLLFLLMNYLTY